MAILEELCRYRAVAILEELCRYRVSGNIGGVM